MNSSLNELNNTNDYVDKLVTAKVIIHDADVQDIINMMQEDLNLEKLNDQNDAIRITQPEIKLPSPEYENELSLNLNEYDKINTISSNTTTTATNTERDNTYDKLNDDDDEKYNSINDQESSLINNDDYDDEDLDSNETDNKHLIEFIDKAKEFQANALDLSRKNIFKIPKKLLELNLLQYIYLEGNDLIKLPGNFFLKFNQLRWLDLRNNKLIELPGQGLDRLESLRTLLLENNKLTHLPDELASLHNLSALSLSDNPLVYPPIDVVNKGLKQVQLYMKREQMRKTNVNIDNMTDQDIEDYVFNMRTLPDEDDVWASDVEDYIQTNNFLRSKSASKYSTSEISLNNYFKKLDSATKKLLTTKSVNPGDTSDPNQALKNRINQAKANANKLSNKLLIKRNKPLPPVEVAVYKNEELEKALRNGRLDTYKKNREKIDAKLQKVNDANMTDEFRSKLKLQQRKNQYKRLVKGVDYVEAARKAPFDISEDHLIVMTNEERELVDKAIADQQHRPVSPNTMYHIEEERRQRDNELQERIRDYTNKLLIRRLNKSQNPKLDRIQAAKDLKELKKIEKELEQRRMELQHNLRSVTGDTIYKETAKLNAKASLANVMKQLK